MADKITNAASYLAPAWSTGEPRDPIPPDLQPANLTEAYAIQDRLIESLSSAVVGWKLGATDPAGQQRFGISEPFTGRLLAGALHPSPAVFATSSFPSGAPVVECEIGVHLDGTLSLDQAPFAEVTVRAAVKRVRPCFEVPGARFRGPRPEVFSLIADNSAARAVVIGAEADLTSVGSLADIAVRLVVNGEPVAEGRGAAAMGDPIRAVTWLANHLAQRRLALEPGAFVLTGALSGAHTLPAHARAVAEFDQLGRVEVSFA
jgi:2-keto-4-pentenoate hydratase